MEKDLSLVKGKYFRVHPITKIKKILSDTRAEWETLDWKEGLGIEKLISINPNLYIVMGFVKLMGDEAKFEDVAFRSIFELDSTKPDMIEEFQNCVSFAKNALEDIK